MHCAKLLSNRLIRLLSAENQKEHLLKNCFGFCFAIWASSTIMLDPTTRIITPPPIKTSPINTPYENNHNAAPYKNIHNTYMSIMYTSVGWLRATFPYQQIIWMKTISQQWMSIVVIVQYFSPWFMARLLTWVLPCNGPHCMQLV